MSQHEDLPKLLDRLALSMESGRGGGRLDCPSSTMWFTEVLVWLEPRIDRIHVSRIDVSVL